MLHQVVVNAPPEAVLRQSLDRLLWVQRMFNNIPVGVALTYAYYTSGWLTAKELAELAEVSEDTARRVLNPLCDLGRVQCQREQRTLRYRVSDELARKLLTRLITVPA